MNYLKYESPFIYIIPIPQGYSLVVSQTTG